jgi:hypothetical protein
MIRQPARPAILAATAAALALAQPLTAPLGAQQTFELPPASPSPTPAPAGPADERAGIPIPPRAQPDPVPETTATPVIQPLPSPSASQPPLAIPAPPKREAAAPAFPPPLAPGQFDGGTSDIPQFVPRGAPQPAEAARTPLDPVQTPQAPTEALGSSILPDGWWLYAVGALVAVALLAGGAWLWRRRKPKPMRLAAPVAGAAADTPDPSEPPRLDLTLDIISATRSVMMFTVQYRLNIANRSDRAVSDLNAAAQLVCARAGAGASAGAAQGLESIARIGPHQARSITGSLQLPLSAIAPLRQGQTPLFIPLVHVTLEGEGLPAETRTFVIGPRSAGGRVHPIPLDQPPGGIAGLVAQAVAVPAASAAA